MGYVRPFILAALALTLAASGPAWAQEDLPSEPLPEAKPLWTYITQESPYADWQLWPGGADFGPASEPHGELGRTFVNTLAAQAIEAGRAELPPGSIVVHEGWNASRDRLLSVAVMYKAAGYNPGAGDWYWLLTSPDAAAAERFLAQGKVASCLACHVGEGGNDYMMSVRLGR